MTEKKQDKLPVSQLIGFALNGCGSSCIAGILGGFLTVYLTDNLLLSMGFITAMMTAARIINAVTEGLSGFLIDMTHTKMGKARPWILGTAFFVALPVFLIFNTPTSFSPTGRDDLGVCKLPAPCSCVRRRYQCRHRHPAHQDNFQLCGTCKGH